MERNQQLDFFRGAFLILITINHFLSYDNIIRYFTYEFIGWVTGAEGFVFISGLTVGLVYTRNYHSKGTDYVTTLAFKRSWLIYKNHACVLVLAFLLIKASATLTPYWHDTYPLVIDKPLLSLILGVILFYQPIYLDILPMYAIFMIFVPEIIRDFTNNKFWLVGIVSASIYLLSTLASLHMLSRVSYMPDYINIGFFDLLCWQFLFVTGILLGFSHYHGKIQELLRSNLLLVISIIISITCFILRHLQTSFSELDFGILVNKSHLGIFRIINFLSLAYIIVFTSNKHINWFKNHFVEALGKNSLNVFLLHILLLIVFKPATPYLNSLLSYKITHHYSFYPITSLLTFTFIIPSLYLVPFFSSKRRVKRSAQVSV